MVTRHQLSFQWRGSPTNWQGVVAICWSPLAPDGMPLRIVLSLSSNCSITAFSSRASIVAAPQCACREEVFAAAGELEVRYAWNVILPVTSMWRHACGQGPKDASNTREREYRTVLLDGWGAKVAAF